jgi:predicted ATP-dependent endonuclease of OLD family
MDSVLGEITLIQIADLGKIKFMSLRVDGEKLVRFVGPNEAGKSTILDRLQNLFEDSSNVPEGIIRKGFYKEGVHAGKEIDRGIARIETSNGYVIEQIIRNTKAGEQKAELKVTQNGMPIQGGPLKFLKSVSSKYPDPHYIANLKEAELFKELSLLLNVDVSEFDKIIVAERQKATEARAAIKMLGAVKQKPEKEKPEGVEEGVEELKKKRDLLTEEYGKRKANHDAATLSKNELSEKKKNAEFRILQLEEELSKLKTDSSILEERLEKADEWFADPENSIDTVELDKVTLALDNYIDDVQLANEWVEYEKDVAARVENNEIITKTQEACLQAEKDKREKSF